MLTVRSALLTASLATALGLPVGVALAGPAPASRPAAATATAPTGTALTGMTRAVTVAATPAVDHLTCHTLGVAGRVLHLCSHQDERAEFAAESTGGSTSGSGSIGCYGTGKDGPRVRALYVRAEGSTDRYSSYAPKFRSWAAAADGEVDAAARATGGHRHIRFATTAGNSGCGLSVWRLTVPASALKSFDATVTAVRQAGYDDSQSKYLIWADTSVYCGIAQVFGDDSPGDGNANNSGNALYARVDTKCWGKAEPHEIMHMLGGVQPTAPHGTAGFHCSDGYDVMCYDDGTSGSTQHNVCPSSAATAFDCRHDDYFAVKPAAGSYLATHWNVANSRYLAPALSDPPAPAPPPSQPSPTASPSSSPAPSPSASPSPVAGVVGTVTTLVAKLPALPQPPRLPPLVGG